MPTTIATTMVFSYALLGIMDKGETNNLIEKISLKIRTVDLLLESSADRFRP